MKRALASIALLVGAGTAHAEQPNLRGFMEVLPTYAYATRGDADGGIGTRITGGIVVPGSVSVGVFLGYRMIRGLTEISERDIEVTTQDLFGGLRLQLSLASRIAVVLDGSAGKTSYDDQIVEDDGIVGDGAYHYESTGVQARLALAVALTSRVVLSAGAGISHMTPEYDSPIGVDWFTADVGVTVPFE